MATTRQEYEQRKEQLSQQVQQSDDGISLNKRTSNLFRKQQRQAGGVQITGFNRVLEVNAEAGYVDVEGMTTYEELVRQMLKHDVMPTVVPELKSITIGGAVSGVGIEASSFKYGLVHEGIYEADVLLADGRVVTATPDNEYRDLFFGLPNSYGTLGYILRLKAKAVPVKKYVRLQHQHFGSPNEFFAAIKAAVEDQPATADFIDGTVFSPTEHYLTRGTFVTQAPYTSNYTFENIYYRSLQQRQEDFLTTHDFIWRWDTDWFWCSKNLGMQQPLIRQLMGRKRLNSVTYTAIMRWNQKWGVANRLDALRGVHSESVIQDVDIPLQHAPEFLDFFHREIGIKPVWICPIRHANPDHQFDLARLDPNTTYINFGFWDIIRGKQALPPGHYNKKVEQKVQELHGFKSLYSSAYYDRDTFWQLYNGPAYQRLKAKYDPESKLVDLFDRVINKEGV